MNKAKVFKAKLIDKKFLNDIYLCLRFEVDGKFDFEAGQYVSIKVGENGERRSYSVANKPGDGGIEIVADISPMGLGSEYLLGLKEGDEVEVLGPMGVFVVNDEIKEFLMIATGSGIVPIWSMVRDLLENNDDKRRIKLVWGMRKEECLFWVEEIKNLERKYKNFEFELVLSRPSKGWNGNRGYVQKYLGEIGEADVYICGNRQMIEEVRVTVLNLGVSMVKIHSEQFFG